MKQYDADNLHPAWLSDYLHGYEDLVPPEYLGAVKAFAARLNPEAFSDAIQKEQIRKLQGVSAPKPKKAFLHLEDKND